MKVFINIWLFLELCKKNIMTTKTQKQRRTYIPPQKPEIQLVLGQRETVIQYCSQTGYVFFQNRWTKKQLKNHIQQVLEKSLMLNKDATVTHIEIELHEDIFQKIAVAHVSGKHDSIDIHQAYDITYTLQPQTSPLAKKLNKDYTEGTIQIRNMTESHIHLFEQKLFRLEEKGLFVTKKKKHEFGADYQITHKKLAKSFMHQMHKEFGGTLKIDAKHFSQNEQQGFIIYRTTFTLIGFLFSKHDIIQYHNAYYYVLQIQQTAQLIELYTHEKLSLDAENAKDANQIKPTFVQVTRTSPQLHVIHPTTFQEVPVRLILDKKIYIKTKKVFVVAINEDVFLIEKQ